MASQQDLLAELTVIESRIQSETAKIPELTRLEQSWRNESNKSCPNFPKSKRESCEAAKAHAKTKADTYKTQLAGIRANIARLDADKKSIEATLKAFNTTQINLSKDGENFEAQLIEATGQADAERAIANAQGAAAVKTAESEAQAQKAKTMVYTVVGAIAALALITIFVLKKIKK